LNAGIKFVTEYQVTDTYIVSVPTPYDKFSKKVDPGYVIAAVKDVLKVAPKGATVVIESTVSPGTIEKYIRPEIEALGFVIGDDINDYEMLDKFKSAIVEKHNPILDNMHLPIYKTLSDYIQYIMSR
jgi:nitrogen regulatory protein PII-like uncharacterized protein